VTSAYQLEINRRNAQNSSGPRSPEGKARSRVNALKHGATARLLPLPGEQPEALERQRDDWTASLQPDDAIEEALVERAFEAWNQLGRILRAQQAKLEKQMLEAETLEKQQECDAVLELGNRLFHDRRGLWQHYPNAPHDWKQVRTSGDDGPGDPNQPVRLVHRLESTAAGCGWLLDRWNELASILKVGECWGSPDRFRAIRLLGRQPLDATVNRDVLRIFLACDVINPHPKGPFHDLYREIGEHPDDRERALQPVLKRLPIERYKPNDPAESRQFLFTLVEDAIERLQNILADHHARAESAVTAPQDRHAFDFSRDGELMRRYETTCDRAFHRALERLRLLRKDGRQRLEGAIEQDEGATPKVEGEIQNGIPASESPGPCSADQSSCAAQSLQPDAGGTDSGPQVAARADEKLRNEPNAAFIDCDGSSGEASSNVTPDDGPPLRGDSTVRRAPEEPSATPSDSCSGLHPSSFPDD
jgi:hypothetical protein